MAQSNNVQREPSMEEILASIRRIIEDSDSTRRAGEAEAEQAPAETGNVHAFRFGLQDEADQTETALAEDDGIGAEVVSFSAADFGLPEEATPIEPMAQNEREAPARLQGHDDGLPSDHPGESGGEPRSAIISEEAGRQVAASFGELSAAFEARSRRSFDEIAAEMMRPMLQDWLDNNLPHLVERLVREEIERIARGGAASR